MDSGGSGRIHLADVLDAFDEQSDPTTPLSTAEVAEAVGCARRTAYDKLETLVERGDLKTKDVGANGRVWWRPAPPTPGVDERLLSERAVELVLRSERLAGPLPEGADDVAVTVDSTASLPDETRMVYLTVEGVDPRAFVEALETFPDVRRVRFLSSVGDTVRVEAALSTDTVLTVVEGFEGRVTGASVGDDAVEFTVKLPGGTDVDAVLEAVRDVSPDVDIVSEQLAFTPRLIRSVVAEDLTDRQLTALQMAYFSGYFDLPRATTGETLADRLDIAPQTFHAHLRKAQNAVFERVFERPIHDPGATSDRG